MAQTEPVLSGRYDVPRQSNANGEVRPTMVEEMRRIEVAADVSAEDVLLSSRIYIICRCCAYCEFDITSQLTTDQVSSCESC
jgi:hypothetical protein